MEMMQLAPSSIRIPGTTAFRVINNILLVVLAFYMMVDGYAVADYFLYGEWYQFDGNSSGWRYASKISFLLTLAVETVLGAVGILAGSLLHSERDVMWLRVAVAALLAFMAFTSLVA